MNAAGRVLDLALARPATLGAGRMVCIDGPAGSGKTTLADSLAALAAEAGLTAAVVHTDDLLDGWGGLPTLGERLRRQVVEPLAAGRGTRYERYDWHVGAFTTWVSLPVVDLLVLEGVGAADPTHAEQSTVVVWVEAPKELRLARGIARDGEAIRPFWERWVPEEDVLHAEHRTHARADLHVDGTTGAVLGPADAHATDV